tara:strand:+ start:2401 stop:3222 length:822 start_codon:yes stop_codon:yes gene_type:complete
MQDKVQEKPYLLIDADSIYFKAACITKNKKEINKIIDNLMLEIDSKFFSSETKVAVKGFKNFRYEVYDKYKSNRPDLDKKLKDALSHGYSHMINKYDAIPANGMEADDLVAIWAYEAREMEIPYVVVGIDKDLLQIPGHHYNFNKLTYRFIDDDEAHKLLMIQCLTGDRSDNIPGIKGIGPKKAEKILEGVKTDAMWRYVKKAWSDHNAGDPKISLRLLSMIKTWEEYESIKSSIQTETTECEQDTGSEREEVLQEPSVCAVSEGDSGVSEGS